MIVVQTFNRAGWPPNSTIELADDAASALFTAVRDYERETGHSLHGDYLVAPTGGLRTLAQVQEMRAAFLLHRLGRSGWQATYAKYNMDAASNAQPSLTSPHLTGECLDFSNNGFIAWLKGTDPQRPSKNRAARYGLVFTLSPPLSKLNDLRHAQFMPGTATAALDVHNLDTTTTGDPDMFTFGSKSRGGWVGGNGGTRNANPEEWPQVFGKFPHYEFGDNDRAFDVFKAAVTTLPPYPAAGGSATDLSGVLAAIAALDKQADDYEAKLEKILLGGFTITGTAKP